MSGNGAAELPDIWTLIEDSVYRNKCSLCRVQMEEGDPIYHNPQRERGKRVRCPDCHEGLPGWEAITAKPAPEPVEPTRSLSHVIVTVATLFDEGAEEIDTLVDLYPQHEKIIRAVWDALERDVLIEAAKARRGRP